MKNFDELQVLLRRLSRPQLVFLSGIVLGVVFILASAVNTLFNALITTLIMPLLKFVGLGHEQTFSFGISGAFFPIGTLLDAVIYFVIVVAAAYLVFFLPLRAFVNRQRPTTP